MFGGVGRRSELGLARGADTRRAEVVEFWRTVEMFSPQRVEKVSLERLVFAVRRGEPLPWEPDHELARRKLRPNQAWRHVVYLGIYRLDAVFEVLSRVFTPDRDSYDERPAGESAIAAFMVGEDGRALVDSKVLSSCAWATGEVLRERRRRRDWLSGFDEATTEFGKAWQDVVTDYRTISGNDGQQQQVQVLRILNGAALTACLAVAVDSAQIDTALPCAEIRISSQIVAKRTADNAGGLEFLNSFIMGDLDRIAKRTAKADIGAALREYLRPEAEIPIARRVDVRAQIGAVLAATAPDAVPAGRWPSHPEHALALNQQLAVSTAMRMTDTGVLGVNGPPGTGKTTMLRDLIAAQVVERARRLAALSDPKKAFAGKPLRWSTGERTRVVSAWRSDLTGFEMVVASTNNGAVQNVTDEIPAADAIDESWRERARAVGYFPDIATALLAPEPDAEASRSPSQSTSAGGWALVAARLGNKTNRSRFVNAFWYHAPDDPADDKPWFGLLPVLKGYEQTAPEQPWSAAVADFRAAEARVRTIRAERSRIYQAAERQAHLNSELADLRRSVSAAGERVELAQERHEAALRGERKRQAEAENVAKAHYTEAQRIAEERRAHAERIAQQRRANAEQAVRSWEAELNRRWPAHAQHRQSRPGLWKRLRTFGAAGRQWSQQDEWLAKEVRVAQDEIRAAQDRVDAALTVPAPEPPAAPPPYEPLMAARRERALTEQRVNAAVQARAESERALQACQAELRALDSLLGHAATALGRHYPDTTWWEDRERRELAALWTDKEWNLVRSELFLAALRLHKAFLRHTPTQMRRNLQAAMDLVSGDVPGDLPEGAVLAAWQSLFFVVPVVSTTFASYARLFGHLGKEALGWLLIDEAGQATPQNAVGALWRAKRAVVVGDPLQLEPVTTLPFRAEQAIRNELGVDEQWSTSRISVQRLADRLTPLGTWLPDDDGKAWVGVPLTVHRRCDQPMFGIVNTIAYDGLMIDGTGQNSGERFDAAYPTLPPSKWIDVAGGGAQGHWIPDEGRQLDRILGTLAELEFDMSEVMVIGPFRDIARQVSGRSRRYPGLVAGTIHTAQGKQADIVVLVLGGAPDRPGARKWAASKPNLLNVAVSRAKRRLYVIGNRQAWSPCRYFDVLATHLPYTTPVQPQ
ncbi:MAG: AAA domain-containing protein [Pseudonocardiaceae bacterium]